jgi:hypothetical protein
MIKNGELDRARELLEGEGQLWQNHCQRRRKTSFHLLSRWLTRLTMKIRAEAVKLAGENT